MKNSSELKIGALLSYVQMALSILIGLIYTPIMLRLLGQNEYGLYNTVSSTISMLSILNLGFGAGYIRYYSQYKARGEQEKIFSLNGLFIVIFSVIGAVSFGCGLFMTTHLDLFFSNGLTASEYSTAFILMLLLTIRLSISFPLSIFSSIITAHERFVFLKVCGTISTILSPLVTLLFLVSGYGSVAMVLVSVILGTALDVIYMYYCVVHLHQKIYLHGFEKEIIISLFSYTFFIAMNIIIDQINWNIDKVLLARYRGTGMVAIYSVGYSLYSYYMSFSTSVSNVFTPRVHGIVNETRLDSLEQRQALTSLFVRVGRIQFLILGLLATGLVFFGKEFIVNFWAGEAYLDSYYVMLLLVLPASIPLIQNLGIEIQRAENRHQFRSICYFFMALINLGLSIYLCQKYGAVGSAMGTALSLVIANGFIMNVYYHKHCNIDIIEFWKNILSVGKGIFLPCLIGVLLKSSILLDSIWKIIAAALVYTVVYCTSMWLFGMNESEKDLIRLPIKRVMSRG